LTKGRIAAADGRLNRIRQVAPMCHIDATWRIRLNLCFLRRTQVHNPNGKSIGSAIFAQLTAVSSGMLGYVFSPNNCRFACGIWAHIIHDSLGPSKPTIQTASRSVQPFLHNSPQSVPILYSGSPLPPHRQTLPLPTGIWTPV